MRSEFQIKLRSVSLRDEANEDESEESVVVPLCSEVWVRKTEAVDCMARCIESRRENGVMVPVEDKSVLTLEMEARPIVGGEAWCGDEGVWFEDMWRATARPFFLVGVVSKSRSREGGE